MKTSKHGSMLRVFWNSSGFFSNRPVNLEMAVRANNHSEYCAFTQVARWHWKLIISRPIIC